MTLRRTACFVRRPMFVLCIWMTNQTIVLFCLIFSVRFVIRYCLTSRANKNCANMTGDDKRKRDRRESRGICINTIVFRLAHIRTSPLLHYAFTDWSFLRTNDITSCSTANEIFLGFLDKLNMFDPTNPFHAPTPYIKDESLKGLVYITFVLVTGLTEQTIKTNHVQRWRTRMNK